jgi:hypothetical protein
MYRALLVSLALASAVACSRGDDSDVNVSFPKSGTVAAAEEPLGPGDVRVRSIDGTIVLAMIDDSVRFSLSDSLRNSVKQQIDSAADTSGFAAMITRSVSGVVSSAMGFVVRVPVQDIENIRYEDGRIEFDSRGKNGRFSMQGKGNGGDEHGRFTPEDGERFVAAVKRRQAELAVR